MLCTVQGVNVNIHSPLIVNNLTPTPSNAHNYFSKTIEKTVQLKGLCFFDLGVTRFLNIIIIGIIKYMISPFSSRLLTSVPCHVRDFVDVFVSQSCGFTTVSDNFNTRFSFFRIVRLTIPSLLCS